ncbi:MAG: hypothetical protein QOH33_2099 [Paraburkholderia sp.]|nr:hypothetical protein [Paraburkholderia sp.]
MKETLIALVLITPIIVIGYRLGIDIPQATFDIFRSVIQTVFAAAA